MCSLVQITVGFGSVWRSVLGLVLFVCDSSRVRSVGNY